MFDCSTCFRFFMFAPERLRQGCGAWYNTVQCSKREWQMYWQLELSNLFLEIEISLKFTVIGVLAQAWLRIALLYGLVGPGIKVIALLARQHWQSYMPVTHWAGLVRGIFEFRIDWRKQKSWNVLVIQHPYTLDVTTNVSKVFLLCSW